MGVYGWSPDGPEHDSGLDFSLFEDAVSVSVLVPVSGIRTESASTCLPLQLHEARLSRLSATKTDTDGGHFNLPIWSLAEVRVSESETSFRSKNHYVEP